jgi:hypothetical protein
MKTKWVKNENELMEEKKVVKKNALMLIMLANSKLSFWTNGTEPLFYVHY